VSHPAGYRLDIQGLRAVAVLLVVAFHIGLPVAGFVGVDVFFVISGFVITTLLLREIDRSGSFDILRFWRRRFIRLMPALALLVTVVAIAAWLFLLPQQRELTAFTGLGSMLLVANVVIARNTGGYFDPPADSNPLLNTWSLSVEEQFYIVFPIALLLTLVLLRRFVSKRTALAVTVGTISLLSFGVMVLAQIGFLTPTWLNFYDPLQRAWEFGVGAALALAPRRFFERGPAVAVGAGIVGVGILFLSLNLLRFPGEYPTLLALLPVSASAFLILAGMSGSNPVTRMLASRPLVAVGDASYSIYLWHWPAISIAILLGVESTPALGAVALLSFIPAWLSFRWVETPLRERAKVAGAVSVRVPMATMAVPIAASLALLFAPNASTGLEGDTELGYLDFIAGNSVECTNITTSVPGTRCRQSHADAAPELVIVGDSHGEHLFPGVMETLTDLPSAYVYLEDWPSIVSSDSLAVIDQIAQGESISTVLVSARWNAVNVESPQLQESLRTWAASGKRVVVVDDVPYFEFHAMECQYARLLGPRPQCTMPVSEFQEFRASYVPRLRDIAVANDAAFVEVGGIFCDEQVCSMVRNDRIQYADNGHVNREGSIALMNELVSEGRLVLN